MEFEFVIKDTKKNCQEFASDFAKQLSQWNDLNYKTLAILAGYLAENCKHTTQKHLTLKFVRNENFILIKARDQGPGFKKDIASCFKKGYTTHKFLGFPVSEGMGLTNLLYVVILMFRGTIQVTSTNNIKSQKITFIPEAYPQAKTLEKDIYYLNHETNKIDKIGTSIYLRLPLNNLLLSNPYNKSDKYLFTTE